MIRAFPATVKSWERDQVLSYIDAMDAYPEHIVEETITRAIRGEANEGNKRFHPTVAEWCQLAVKIIDEHAAREAEAKEEVAERERMVIEAEVKRNVAPAYIGLLCQATNHVARIDRGEETVIPETVMPFVDVVNEFGLKPTGERLPAEAVERARELYLDPSYLRPAEVVPIGAMPHNSMSDQGAA